MEPQREPKTSCPFNHNGAGFAIDLPKRTGSSIQSLRSQVDALDLSYQHRALSRAIYQLETVGDCPVSHDPSILGQEAAHLPLVNAAISIFFEKMYKNFVDWRAFIASSEHDLPLIIHFNLDEPAIPLTYQEAMERINQCKTLETQTVALRNLMESTSAFFFGPYGCYGPKAQEFFSEIERKMLKSLLDAPKYPFKSVELNEYEYLNVLSQAGIRTGLRILTKLALVTRELLSQQLNRSPTPIEFQSCFLASQDFCIDMMRLPLGIAERIDRSLNRDMAISKNEIDFYDSGFFALVREQECSTVGLKPGVIERFNGYLSTAVNPASGRSGLDFSTGCPALYASANGEAVIRDLADWVGSLFSRTILTEHKVY